MLLHHLVAFCGVAIQTIARLKDEGVRLWEEKVPVQSLSQV
jgi:hypothetical protein